MIPKIIHYCWFGGAEMPDKVKYCIETWRKKLPDYELRLWDEDTFDLDRYQFARDAYDKKKWAFVSDLARIHALVTEGGIYLDTDIEVLKPFDDLLGLRAFIGTDEAGYLTAAAAAAEKEHPFFLSLLEAYKTRPFILPDGSLNMEVNNTLMQQMLADYGYRRANERQHLKEGLEVFPDDYFHVVSLTSGKRHQTPNSYCIHWHTLLWIPWQTRLIRFLRMKILVPILGAERYTRLTEKIKGR